MNNTVDHNKFILSRTYAVTYKQPMSFDAQLTGQLYKQYDL